MAFNKSRKEQNRVFKPESYLTSYDAKKSETALGIDRKKWETAEVFARSTAAATESIVKIGFVAMEIATKTSLVPMELAAKTSAVAIEMATRTALLPITLSALAARNVSTTVDDIFDAGDQRIDEIMAHKPARLAAYAGSAALVGVGAVLGHKIGMPQSSHEWLVAGGATEIAAVGIGSAANVGITRQS